MLSITAAADVATLERHCAEFGTQRDLRRERWRSR
jgi:hypothetical protein